MLIGNLTKIRRPLITISLSCYYSNTYFNTQHRPGSNAYFTGFKEYYELITSLDLIIKQYKPSLYRNLYNLEIEQNINNDGIDNDGQNIWVNINKLSKLLKMNKSLTQQQYKNIILRLNLLNQNQINNEDELKLIDHNKFDDIFKQELELPIELKIYLERFKR